MPHQDIQRRMIELSSKTIAELMVACAAELTMRNNATCSLQEPEYSQLPEWKHYGTDKDTAEAVVGEHLSDIAKCVEKLQGTMTSEELTKRIAMAQQAEGA